MNLRRLTRDAIQGFTQADCPFRPASYRLGTRGFLPLLARATPSLPSRDHPPQRNHQVEMFQPLRPRILNREAPGDTSPLPRQGIQRLSLPFRIFAPQPAGPPEHQEREIAGARVPVRWSRARSWRQFAQAWLMRHLPRPLRAREHGRKASGGGGDAPEGPKGGGSPDPGPPAPRGGASKACKSTETRPLGLHQAPGARGSLTSRATSPIFQAE